MITCTWECVGVMALVKVGFVCGSLDSVCVCVCVAQV